MSDFEIWLSLDGAERIQVLLPGPFHIGRSEAAGLCVENLLVSRSHLRLENRDSHWWMIDTSANGTFDELGERITEICLDRSVNLRLGGPDGPRLSVELVPDGRPEPSQSGVLDGVATQFLDDGIDVTRPKQRIESEARGEPFARVVQPAISTVNLSIATDDGTTLVEDVTMSARRATLTALLGPTGAGKSTLLNTLAGNRRQVAGSVEVHGVDLYANITRLQIDIGLVPQEDIVHLGLTVDQALTFGAELRLPDSTTPTEIEHVVTRVCSELGLVDHRHKKISKLSGGQRKRASVALELLTEPSLLLLDEPTSGLDPGYEAALMQLFRRLVDNGRTILVVTHSMSSLDLCDQVIFLGTGGWIGYAGPPSDALTTLGVDDYPTAFRKLEAPNPRPLPQAAPLPAPSVDENVELSYPTGPERQLSTLLKRNAALLLADPRGLAVLFGSALVPAILLAALVGNGTLSGGGGASVGSARTLLGGMVIAAGVIGAANGLREIVRDLPIYRRERAAGLRRGAYLLSKVLVLSAVTALQTVALVIVATAFASPSYSNLLPARLEIIMGCVLTGLVSLMLGLFISAFVSSSEKALALIPVVFVAFWLFSGTVSDLAGKPVLSQVAYISPSSWGMAAVASTADLPALEHCGGEYLSEYDSAPLSGSSVCDARWGHNFVQWVFNLFMLLLLGVMMFLGIDWAMARKETIPSLRSEHLVRIGARNIQSLMRKLTQ